MEEKAIDALSDETYQSKYDPEALRSNKKDKTKTKK
jgi:hypothetical protein